MEAEDDQGDGVAGSGASRDYGAPLTGDLTNIIEREVRGDAFVRHMAGDAAFDAIKSELTGYLKEPGNFEQIYHCAHELRFTFSPTPGAADEFKPILRVPLEQAPIDAGGPRNSRREDDECDLRRNLTRLRANTLGLSPLARIIQCLRADHVTRIYTTNYDDFRFRPSQTSIQGSIRFPPRAQTV